MLKLFKSNYIIGLDIGASAIKFAQFSQKEGRLQLIKSGLEEISSQQDALAALKKLFIGVNLKKSRVMVSINCPQTASRKIIVPYMPRHELGEAIMLEAKNYFPFSLAEAALDLRIEQEVIEKGVKKFQVLLATSPRKTVNETLDLLKQAGIRPAVLFPVSLALEKLARLSPSQDAASCLLDIGARFAELVVIKGKTLLFSRKIFFGADMFTRALTTVIVTDKGKLQLSLAEAESIKRQAGLASSEDTDKISASQIQVMLRSSLEQLVGEVNRCLAYYHEENPQVNIAGITLFGRGALLKGLPEFLTRELGIEVKLGLQAVAPEFGVAWGLGLSEGSGVNLLPPELKEQTQILLRQALWENTLAISVLFLIFVYSGLKIQISNFEKRIAVANLEVASLKSQIKDFDLQAFSKKALAGEPGLLEIFKELSNVVPAGVYLTELSIEKNSVTLKGEAISSDPQESLSTFSVNLEKGMFKAVKLSEVKELKGRSGRQFSLTCQLK